MKIGAKEDGGVPSTRVLLVYVHIFLLAVGVVLGLDEGMLPPRAEMTVTHGRVQRDDLHYFQVLTEAWRSTRVRVSIEDCTPHTALIASFGAEPTPSRHELLAPSTLDRNGTCGMDVITRPSYTRDGVWHFAVIGGLPLHSQRYFAGPPDTLEFEVAVITEPVVYSWLDQGLAPPLGVDDDYRCSRTHTNPPVIVPTIMERSSVGIVDGNADPIAPDSQRVGQFLPRVGVFSVRGASGSSPSDAGSWWLGAFTAGAYDELVVVNFEIAALQGDGVTAAPAAEGDKGESGDGVGEEGGQDAGRRGLFVFPSDEDGAWQVKSRGGRWPLSGKEGPQARREETDMTAVGGRVGFVGGGLGSRDGDSGDDDWDLGSMKERYLANDGSEHETRSCEVKLCAAAAMVPFWGLPGKDEGWRSKGGVEMVCVSVEVQAGGEPAAVRDSLKLPPRPQAGRWYVAGSVSCGTLDVDSNGKNHADDRERRHLASNNNESAKSHLFDSRKSSRSKTASSPTNIKVGGDDSVGADNMTADHLGVEGDTASNDTATIMMEDAISLQRDWAHVQWSAEELLPVWQVRREQEGLCHMPAATAAAGGNDPAEATFALSAAVVAKSCPSGRVGIDGVDMRRVKSRVSTNAEGGGKGAEDAEMPRISCMGEVVPTIMARRGAATVYEGRSRVLSNLVHSDGLGSSAAGADPGRRLLPRNGGRGLAEKDGGNPETVPGTEVGVEDGGDLWWWNGLDPPSVWYAVDISGREVGASMTVSLVVNSSAAAAAAAEGSSSLGYSHGWEMRPISSDDHEGAEGDTDVLSPVDEASVSLSVVMRVGSLPVLSSNGTDQQDTWVLSSSDALIETEEMDNPYPDATAATFPDGNSPFWQTTYTWNFTHPPPLSSYVGAAAGGGLSGAGQAGTSATTATTLFLGVYAECDVGAGSDGGGDGNGRTRRLRRRSRRVAEVEVDGVGDGEGAGHNGGGDGVKSGDLAGSWALGIAPRVEFSYCDEEVCPEARGVCRVSNGGDGNDYVPASKCYCAYGLGGEGCDQRVVSYASLIWQTILLVGSNLAVIPGVREALRLGASVGSAPAVVLALNGAASAVYHMCDLELTCAGGLLSYHTLQALDFFFSFFSVAVLVLHLCPMPWDEPLTGAGGSRNKSESPSTGTLGSEDINDPHFLGDVRDSVPRGGDVDSAVVSGGDRGSDALGGNAYGHSGTDKTRTARKTQSFYSRRGGVASAGSSGGGGNDTSGGRVSATLGNRAATFNCGPTAGMASAMPHYTAASSFGRARGSMSRGTGGISISANSHGTGEEGSGSFGQELGAGSAVGAPGTRLASLYVCLIPPLLAAVADSPTAGTNLALVFVMCGGLLTFSWGRLVARDMRLLDAEAAREEWRSSRSTAASAGAASAALEVERADFDLRHDHTGVSAVVWDEEKGGVVEEHSDGDNDGDDDDERETRALIPSNQTSGGGEDFRTGGKVSSTNSETGMASVTRGDPLSAAGDEERGRDTERAKGDADSSGGSSGGGDQGRERGDLKTEEKVVSGAEDGDGYVSSLSQSQQDEQAPSASRTGAYSGRDAQVWKRDGVWNDPDRFGSDTMADSGRPNRARSSCSRSLGRLRLRAVLCSSRRIILEKGLIDWRRAGLGATGFVAGLACFAAQGEFPSWYHLWHSAWHVLAMGSTAFMLRARRWGMGSGFDSTGGFGDGATSLYARSSPPPIRDSEDHDQRGRRSRGASFRARWGSVFGTQLGGRVEARASYEMVPTS